MIRQQVKEAAETGIGFCPFMLTKEEREFLYDNMKNSVNLEIEDDDSQDGKNR